MSKPERSKRTPRKILLATDLSARCDRALDRAAALAAAWQAELIAVHALEQSDDFYAGDLRERLPSWRRPPDASVIVEEQLRRDMLHTGVKITAIAERGDPAELLLRVAETRGCDLIVTGIARDETLGRFGLGATVDRLLRRSRLPLLIVRQRVRGPYGNILVATDFSDGSRCALETAAELFPDRRLSLLHAYEPPFVGMAGDPDRYRSEYRAVAARESAAFLAGAAIPKARRDDLELLVEPGRPSQLVQQYVHDRGVDLVALGTHGRSALFDILLGSTAREILAGLPCDALVVREPRAAVE